MKKFFQHPAVVMFVLITFVTFSLVGCTTPVTKIDANGKPYTVDEYSASETLAAILLFFICLGCLACSFIHGAADNTVFEGVLQGDSSENSESFNKRIFIDSLGDKDLTRYKPVQIQDMSGNVLSELMVSGDDMRSNDRIIAMISPALANYSLYEKFFTSCKVTNKIKLSVLVKSDFSMDSHKTATIKIRDIEFLEHSPRESDYHHTTFIYKGKRFDVFLEVEQF